MVAVAAQADNRFGRFVCTEIQRATQLRRHPSNTTMTMINMKGKPAREASGA
jgi:hypothetical protein